MINKLKLMRLYGLILSMISIAKLLFFDLSYDSLATRAAGVLVAGLLCLGISFAYGKYEKVIAADMNSKQEG